jgi:hypothetical protein
MASLKEKEASMCMFLRLLEQTARHHAALAVDEAGGLYKEEYERTCGVPAGDVWEELEFFREAMEGHATALVTDSSLLEMVRGAATANDAALFANTDCLDLE